MLYRAERGRGGEADKNFTTEFTENTEGKNRRADRDLGKVENRKLGRAEDRLTEGWPEGRSIGGDASQRLPKAAPQEEQIGKSANQMSGRERWIIETRFVFRYRKNRAGRPRSLRHCGLARGYSAHSA